MAMPFAFASVAQAQSGVTLYGMMDVGLSYVSNAGAGHSFNAEDSIWTPSVWGIRGAEDLGDGYKAIFDLTSQFSVNNGNLIAGAGSLFLRQALVGLSKDGVGQITFGRQFNLMADFLFVPPR